MATLRSDQTNELRRRNGLSTALMDEARAEDILVAYQIERQRITAEREAEIKAAEEESKRSFKDALLEDPITALRESAQASAMETLKENLYSVAPGFEPIVVVLEGESIQDAITDKIKDKFYSLVPGLEPIATLLEEATKRQLEVQDAIAPKIKSDSCGVSVETPFFKYHYISPDCRPPGAKPAPAPTPPSGAAINSGGQWRAFASTQTGKNHTLTWNYTGWVWDFFVMSNGQMVGLNNEFVTVGNSYPVYTFVPANPWASWENGLCLPRGADRRGDGLETVGGRMIGGYAATAPTPTQSLRYDHQEQNNSWQVPTDAGWSRRSFYGAGTVLSKGKFGLGFNPEGNWLLYVSINFRMDITIGEMSGWDRYSVAPCNQREIFFLRFFLCPMSQGSVGSAVANLPNIVTFDRTPPQPKIKPPPPPPKEKCDCMANCCPQNQVDLSEIKRLLRVILAKQDETDINIHRVRVKQGEQSELLGLDKFPYTVQPELTAYDEWVSLVDTNPLTNIIFKPWLTLAVQTGKIDPKRSKPPIEIANLTEFIAFLSAAKKNDSEIDYIGTPVEMALWDTDPNKPGNQTQKIKPKTIFKAIEAVLNEVTLTQRIIGIDKLPAKVPAKWVTADNTYKMMQAVSKQLGVSAQLEFLKQLVGIGEAQTEITSLVDFLDWQSDQLDDVLGDWEIEVNIADGDLIKAGEQGTTAYVLNMASAMQKTIEASMASNISEKAIINMLTRVLIELQGMKQEIGKSASQVDCIRDYLGFPTTTKVVKVPAHCNFPKPDKGSKDSKATNKVEDLSTFLEGTSLDIETEVYEAKGTYQDILVDLQQAAAITRAKDYQRVGSVKDVGTLLTGLATAYGLLKPPSDPSKTGGKMPPDSFEAFCEAVESDFSDVPGRVSSTPDAPYGKPRKNRPRLREIGKGKGNADA